MSVATVLKSSRLAFAVWGLASFVLLSLASTDRAQAASAVALDPETLAFAYRYGDESIDLKEMSVEQCRKLGGKTCDIIRSCKSSGHGAVALDVDSRHLGAVCGAKSEEAATLQASNDCKKAGGKNCEVTTRFFDPLPSFDPNQESLRGHWSSSCGARNSYTFGFVAPTMFQIAACYCKLRQDGVCKLRRCSAQKGLFGPGSQPDEYISPTFGRKVTRTGPDRLVLRDVSSDQYLQRCEAQ